jgi:16S rRNA (guanine966-N2)-methyltransferase
VRVIAGSARGRALRAPAGTTVRPTSDRVREAIFDVLANVVDLEGARVADLFAGSGAMGIEALSRGAGSAVFVDRDPGAIEAVRSNLVAVGFDDADTTIVRSDVVRWLSARRRDGLRRDAVSLRFDVAFVDPPYAFGDWARLLALLESDWAVLESSRPVEIAGELQVVKEKRYGGTLVTLVGASPQRAHERGRP